jgi:hypothetical protein
LLRLRGPAAAVAGHRSAGHLADQRQAEAHQEDQSGDAQVQPQHRVNVCRAAGDDLTGGTADLGPRGPTRRRLRIHLVIRELAPKSLDAAAHRSAPFGQGRLYLLVERVTTKSTGELPSALSQGKVSLRFRSEAEVLLLLSLSFFPGRIE